MAWDTSTRRSRLPPNWAALRAEVLDRDGHRCRWVDDGHRCPDAATEVDHIIEGDDHRPANLQSLCHPHHQAKTIADRWRADRRQARPKPRHPGLR
jgi:hypothetical protein